jgi:hypothetical protein
MSSPQKTRENNPLQNLTEGTAEKPGMYLIALRAHLNHGKSIIKNVFDTVAEALPAPTKARTPERQ